MPLGTAKRLSTVYCDLIVKYKETLIAYQHAISTWESTSTHLWLSKITLLLLDIQASSEIYISLIFPIVTYCSLLPIHSTKTQSEWLKLKLSLND